MAYDLEEQEQLASLKAWWRQYGTLTTSVALAVALGFAAWNSWSWYQRNQTANAVAVYEDLLGAATAGDGVKVREYAGVLFEQYRRTPYAQMAGLAAAKASFDSQDLKTAQAQLQWVIENARDADFKTVARLRLAGVLLDEGDHAAALKTLEGTVSTAYQSAVADRRGDILVASNDLSGARAAYNEAIDKTDPRTNYAQVIRLKLDALGEPPPASEEKK